MREATGFLRGLPPRFVEKGRHCDDYLANRAQAAFGVLLEALQHERTEHFGRSFESVDFAARNDVAHVPFETLDIAVGGQRPTLHRFFADRNAIVVEEQGAGRKQVARAVGNGGWPPRVVHVGHQRVGRAQIDSDGRLLFDRVLSVRWDSSAVLRLLKPQGGSRRRPYLGVVVVQPQVDHLWGHNGHIVEIHGLTN